ncbi:MAG TPA: hypothetical protein VFV68_04680 [Agriterribacter sp.]|nr:hypothetical protein [Agriterribacter sp.]
MEIDWFTVVAQVLNFLILVWLLKKYLYQPVLNAIDAREKRITGQLTDAANKEAEAVKERELFQQKNEAFEQERANAFNKAMDEVKTERLKQMEQVRLDADTQRLKMKKAWQEEQENMTTEIRNKIQQEVLAITAKTLADLGSASLEQQLVNVFIQRIKSLKTDEKKRFNEAFDASDHTLHVKTAREVPVPLKTDLEKELQALTTGTVTFQYELDPALISGIELSVHNYQLSWNVENYLNDLTKHINLSMNNTNKKEEDVPT